MAKIRDGETLLRVSFEMRYNRDQAEVTPAPSVVAPSLVINPPIRKAVLKSAMERGVGGPRCAVNLGVVRLLGVEASGLVAIPFVRVVG